MIPLDPLPNLIDQVYARILEAITDRSLPPGHRIRQNELAEKLGVSRQPVSHALHLLHRQGLVAESGRRGFEVTRLDPERIRQLYEVRGAIDALAARLAAGRVKADASGRAQIESPLSPRGYVHSHLPPLSPNERGRYVIDNDNAHPLGREWLIANLISHPGRMQQGRAAMAAHAPLDGDRAGRTRLPRKRLDRTRGNRRTDFGGQRESGRIRSAGACADGGTDDRGETESDE